MTTFWLMLVPPAALALYAGVRYLAARPLRRHELNILFALLLIGYFLTTAGLGIFWVANQELPVFDLHYLFGYITLGLVLVHLGFNWKPVTVFLRRRAPSAALSADRRSWRPAVRAGGWIAVLALFGATCFWLGVRRGASRIEVVEVTATDPPSMQSPVEDNGVDDDAPRAARPAFRQMVRADGDVKTLADYYHDKSKHSRASVMAEAGGLDWSTRPSVFKEYPDAPRVTLPRDFVETAISTGDAIDLRRRRVDALTPRPMSVAELSTLLHMANGITAEKVYPGRTYYLRSAPSAGALYPTVTYVLVNRAEGVDPGLYHYGVKDHELRRLRHGPGLVEELAAASASGHLVRNASVVLVFSSVYFRSSWKYGERAYRYCLMDAGHVALNAMLGAAALGYASAPVGGFDDRLANGFLGINEREEGTLLLVPVGQAASAAPPLGAPAFAPRPAQIGGDGNPLLLLAHGRTYLGLTEGEPRARPSDRSWQDKPYTQLPVIELPQDLPRGDPLDRTIQRRRSNRNWLAEGMTLEQLGSVLYHAYGVIDGGVGDPSVEASHLVRLYLVVNGVQGLDPGVYYYRRQDHALAVIKTGDFRRRTFAISLFQEVVGESGVALIKTIDVESLGEPDGDRGYRYAALDAGMLGGNVYLQTVALGLGCTGIGAFFDDEVSEVIGVDPSEELIIYMSAIGVTAPE
ncbi:MAG: SagB/ThcOx family dehydrogenase [Planctomycetota bacterium]